MLFALTIATAVGFKNFLTLPPALGMMLGLGYLQFYSFFLSRAVDEAMVLFFFGIIFAVGGLGVLGYLALASQGLYAGLGLAYADVIIGLLSAIVDNIPLMFAVLTMDSAISDGQWLLTTLTCGVGGAIVSVGLGYGAAVGCHLWLNAGLF